jgi:predicted PhzF superfamily epimerase YddE/YHI9
VFAVGAGIDEDPVTGSAHCLIGPLLAARTGRTEFTGEQASARGGIVGMRVEGDRVILSGRAVTVLEGTLREDPPPA